MGTCFSLFHPHPLLLTYLKQPILNVFRYNQSVDAFVCSCCRRRPSFARACRSFLLSSEPTDLVRLSGDSTGSECKKWYRGATAPSHQQIQPLFLPPPSFRRQSTLNRSQTLSVDVYEHRHVHSIIQGALSLSKRLCNT